MAIATSGTTNYTTTRDLVITRALRILGAYGQGETPSANSITEAAQALNDLAKEFETDGMELWKLTKISFATVASQATYTISTDSSYNVLAPAPLRVHQAWTTDSNNHDRPILVITESQYQNLGDKTQTGAVSQVWYQPPGPIVTAKTDAVGTLYCYLTPDANAGTVNLLATSPFQDFDNSTDEPDFPSYWNNALVWGLASDLSFEYGLGLSERGMIQKRAMQARIMALSYGTEEGSLYIQPLTMWN